MVTKLRDGRYEGALHEHNGSRGLGGLFSNPDRGHRIARDVRQIMEALSPSQRRRLAGILGADLVEAAANPQPALHTDEDADSARARDLSHVPRNADDQAEWLLDRSSNPAELDEFFRSFSR